MTTSQISLQWMMATTPTKEIDTCLAFSTPLSPVQSDGPQRPILFVSFIATLHCELGDVGECLKGANTVRLRKL